jgi:hypothetical protein
VIELMKLQTVLTLADDGVEAQKKLAGAAT